MYPRINKYKDQSNERNKPWGQGDVFGILNEFFFSPFSPMNAIGGISASGSILFEHVTSKQLDVLAFVNIKSFYLFPLTLSSYFSG